MDFYNKHFYRLIRHVDPNGMLNVPINVFADQKCLSRYFRTNNDYRKLDVPWMCDQLIILLENFDDIVTISSTIQFLQNDFQRIKYPFVLISEAFIGLIIIHQNALKAYYCHCKNSTITLYKSKIIFDKIPKKKNRKKANSANQLYQEMQEVIQNQEIELLNQNQAIISSFEPNVNETNNILNCPRPTTHITENKLSEIIVLNQTVPNIPIQHNHSNLLYFNNEGVSNCIHRRSDLGQSQVNIQPIEEFSISDKNVLIEYPPLPQNESEHLMNIDVVQPINIEKQQLINQPNYTVHLLDQQIQTDQLIIDQPINTTSIQEQHNQLIITNDSSPKNILNLPLKRKTLNEGVKRNYKKRPIQKSDKAINNRLRKLEGELYDRPLEIMAMKYIQNPMNHLPLRYAMYHTKLNIPFAALTLNMELEANKNQDDIFNNEIDMNSYKAIIEKLNNSNTSRICIFQQCMNNSLPHLGLIPLAEEFLTKNSLVWRDTINEINRKLEDSLEELSPITKINLTKWEEFKEKMKHRVQQSLVAQKTLIGPEISCIDKLQPDIVFPLFNQFDDLLNGKTVTEQQNFTDEVPQINTMDNISHMPIIETGLPTLLPPDKVLYNIQENYVMNQCEQVQMQSFQNSIVKPVDVICHKQPIDSMKLISNILLQSPENTSCLKFTDLCPIHVTNRKNAILVLIDLLGLHTKGLVKLSQPCNIKEPSSISIEIL